MALVLKTSEVKASVGSNPTLSVDTILCLIREISSAVERFPYKEDVTGSIPVSPIISKRLNAVQCYRPDVRFVIEN